ncbi:MAG: hypothetical protein II038_10340 [Lachnospiraceae bacterium]|nr:hypothetical protein [Lachnospiraceae bacterium]
MQKILVEGTGYPQIYIRRIFNMTNSETKDKIIEIYRDNWSRLPAIYRFEKKKTLIWFGLLALTVIMAFVFWYIFICMGGFGAFETAPDSFDTRVVFKTPENLGLNIFLLFVSFVFIIIGGLLVFIFLRARKLEKKLYSEACRHAAHLSEKKREEEFREKLELKKIEDEEIEEMHRNMKPEFCPKCGLLMIPGNNICPSCGANAEGKE